jgi:hypothetical protein
MTDLTALIGKRVRVTRHHHDSFNGLLTGVTRTWEGRLARITDDGHAFIVRDDRVAMVIPVDEVTIGEVTIEEAVTEVDRLAGLLRDLAARDLMLDDDDGTTVARLVLQAGYVRGAR